ncbi:MAG: ATP12 family protein [Pseudomonadota bacterium]
MSMSKAKAENRELPKRFYEEASAGPDERGWLVRLDGRPVKTPARHALAAPCEALANAIAGEWDAQREVINPFTMPLTRLAHVVIDRMADLRQAAAKEVVRFARTDTLCIRSEDPELAARQAGEWDPWLDWSRNGLDAPLIASASLSGVEQPEASLQALARRAEALDDWRLTGLVSAAPVFASAVLAFALLEGEGEAQTLFEVSRLEERHQNERWGEDREAVEANANKLRDLKAVERLFRILDEAEI